MKYGYIVKITGQNIYNEAQLATSMTAYSVGTRIESDLRFRKDFFLKNLSCHFGIKTASGASLALTTFSWILAILENWQQSS